MCVCSSSGNFQFERFQKLPRTQVMEFALKNFQTFWQLLQMLEKAWTSWLSAMASKKITSYSKISFSFSISFWISLVVHCGHSQTNQQSWEHFKKCEKIMAKSGTNLYSVHSVNIVAILLANKRMYNRFYTFSLTNSEVSCSPNSSISRW